jgi:hypothetical protein
VRTSLFGFLLGSVLAGGGLYYYVIDEYKVSNELLTEDIYVRSACPGQVRAALMSLAGTTSGGAAVRRICQGLGGGCEGWQKVRAGHEDNSGNLCREFDCFSKCTV